MTFCDWRRRNIPCKRCSGPSRVPEANVRRRSSLYPGFLAASPHRKQVLVRKASRLIASNIRWQQRTQQILRIRGLRLWDQLRDGQKKRRNGGTTWSGASRKGGGYLPQRPMAPPVTQPLYTAFFQSDFPLCCKANRCKNIDGFTFMGTETQQLEDKDCVFPSKVLFDKLQYKFRWGPFVGLKVCFENNF